MKHLSISMFIMLLVFTLSGAGLISRPIETATAATQAVYYWYSVPSDTYVDRKTVDDETYEMWVYYGVFVNTNPAGGTLVDRGYTYNNYPHTFFPAVYLYAHY